LEGVDVRLCNRSPARLEQIRAAGGITVTGAVEGVAPIAVLTTDMHEAVRGADVLAVTVPDGRTALLRRGIGADHGQRAADLARSGP
jgi:hypothetical protein